MSFIEIVILSVLIFLDVYLIVDRICKCLEKMSMSKAFDEFLKNNNTQKKPE